MIFIRLINSTVDALAGVVGTERWNEYVGHPLDRMFGHIALQIDRMDVAAGAWVERKTREYEPKVEAYCETHIFPWLETHIKPKAAAVLDYIEHRVDHVIDSAETAENMIVYISSCIQDTDIINYAIKSFILGAIVEMEMRIITDVDGNWDGVADTDYDLLVLADSFVAREVCVPVYEDVDYIIGD